MQMNIAPGLNLDSDTFVTKTQAILAQRGKGKSHLAQVEAEELLEAGHQVVAVDPTGAWWGLRSSKSGKRRGYSIAVFGGEHADIPIEATAGEVVADAIATEHFSAIIDLSLFRKNESLRFMAIFMETLYRRNRQALHLFIDEADVVAPQKTFSPEQARCLGAAEDIVRRGRIKGIGCTLISQRPQVINKDVLSQVDMLTTLGMNHPKDLGAIDAWISVHGDPKTAAKMQESLPALPRGDAWLWSPSMKLFKRVRVRDKHTFDSGRTPKAGETHEPPKVLAEVDLKRLGSAIADTVERAKESDPKIMRAEIARLKAQIGSVGLAKGLADARPAVPSKADTKAIANYERTMKKWSGVLDQYLERINGAGTSMRALLDRGESQLEGFRSKVGLLTRTVERVEPSKPSRPTRIKHVDVASNAIHRPSPSSMLDGDLPFSTNGMPPGEAAILSALIQHPDGLSGPQLTVIVGYARRTNDTYLSKLSTRGYVERHRGLNIATNVGRKALPDAKPLPKGAALRDHWLRELPSGESAILAILMDEYPKTIDNAEIETRTGFARRTRDTYMSKLSTRKLLVRARGGASASPVLFE